MSGVEIIVSRLVVGVISDKTLICFFPFTGECPSDVILSPWFVPANWEEGRILSFPTVQARGDETKQVNTAEYPSYEFRGDLFFIPPNSFLHSASRAFNVFMHPPDHGPRRLARLTHLKNSRALRSDAALLL
jgi:hypothetical protein